MKLNNLNNASYFSKNIKNYEQHLKVWNQLHNELTSNLSKLKTDYKNQITTKQLDEATFEFGMYLSNFAAIGLDLNYKSKPLIVDDTKSEYQIHKELFSLLEDCYGIYEVDQFYPFLNELIQFTKSDQLATLSLFNDYNQLTKITENELDINPFEFMFINAFNGYKNSFFYYTQQASAIVLLLRIGYQLQWVNDDILVNITQVISLQITERFNSWSEFIYNYILAMVYDQLDEDNPDQALNVALFWINQLQPLLLMLNLEQKDSWIKKVIKYVE